MGFINCYDVGFILVYM